MQTRTKLRLLDVGMATLGLALLAGCLGQPWAMLALVCLGLALITPMFR